MQVRVFAPHPGAEDRYLEMDEGVVRRQWNWNWTYIKMGCEHWGTIFVCKYLTRTNTGPGMKQPEGEDVEEGQEGEEGQESESGEKTPDL